MFRAYCYLELDPTAHKSNPGNRVRLTTEAVQTYQEADALLNHLLTLPGVTGGDIETHAGPIGWVLETELETIQYLARMQEAVVPDPLQPW